ncbi:MAG TPA: hypothetical protein VI461_14015 [Chitinophagaceae bacterium]|nr:hypothetical protein [Chitinophagaceae bacterium]
MKKTNRNQQEENFSDDPGQNLRIENELLKLKMQAERGALFGGNMEGLPPEVEAEFLKNVQQFEDSFDKAREITVYECIGSPSYKNADELRPEEVKMEVEKMMELLHSKDIILEVLGRYELSVIYKFITEELFHEKIRKVSIPGYIHSFVYEEFHPNHHVDIARTAQDFLDHWFEKGFTEDSTELAARLITAEGKIYSREEVLGKLHNCLNSYQSFINIKFRGSDTSVEWDEKEGKGMGHAEGMFSYDAEVESGESIHIEGPFKLYMINEDGFWRIFYFVFPGFAW